MDGSLVMNVKKDYLDYVAWNVYGGSDFETCTFDLEIPIEMDAVVGSDAILMTDMSADAGTTTTKDNHDHCIYMTSQNQIENDMKL